MVTVNPRVISQSLMVLVLKVQWCHNWISPASSPLALGLNEVLDVFGLRGSDPFNIQHHVPILLWDTANVRDGLQESIQGVEVEPSVWNALSSDFLILGNNLGSENTALVGQQDAPQVLLASVEISHDV